jgi:hypothetical protein
MSEPILFATAAACGLAVLHAALASAALHERVAEMRAARVAGGGSVATADCEAPCGCG